MCCYPNVCAGKGPQKQYYRKLIDSLHLEHVEICTPWLEAEDYPMLLGNNSRVPTRTFSVRLFFFFCSAHAFAPSRHERTTGKSERLTDGASTSYEQLRKVPPLLEDFLSRWKES